MERIPKPVEGFKIVGMSDGAVIQNDDILHTLNTTAYDIYSLMDGSNSIGDIIEELQKQYPDEEDIPKVVMEFINQLSESGLIEISPL